VSRYNWMSIPSFGLIRIDIERSEGNDGLANEQECMEQANIRKLSDEDIVLQYVSNKVILSRGVRREDIQGYETNKFTAGNGIVKDREILPLATEKQVRDYIAKGGQPLDYKYKEYTTSIGKAISFAKGGGLIIIEIEAKYLTKGSETEHGWIVADNAPAKKIAVIEMPKEKRSPFNPS
jgi:hypothetical protein